MRFVTRFVLPLGIVSVLAAAGWVKWQHYNFHPVLFKNPDQLTPVEIVTYHAYALANGDFRRTDRVASKQRLLLTAENSAALIKAWKDSGAWSKIKSFSAEVIGVPRADLVNVQVKALGLYSDSTLQQPKSARVVVDYVLVKEEDTWKVDSTHVIASEEITD